jgi:hypothetical protein
MIVGTECVLVVLEGRGLGEVHLVCSAMGLQQVRGLMFHQFLLFFP